MAGEGAGAEPYFAPILFSLRVLDAPGLATFAVDARHRLYVVRRGGGVVRAGERGGALARS